MAVCISQSANTLGQCMNPTILSPVMVEQTRLFNFGVATVLREGKLWIQTSYKTGDG